MIVPEGAKKMDGLFAKAKEKIEEITGLIFDSILASTLPFCRSDIFNVVFSTGDVKIEKDPEIEKWKVCFFLLFFFQFFLLFLLLNELNSRSHIFDRHHL